VRTERCPTTQTADGHFLLDRRGPTVLAGGCSGHGFMFSPALGELIAGLVEGARSPELFRIDRPGLSPLRAISQNL
jgi:sarcosine oxidase